jgi:hypothetical protein
LNRQPLPPLPPPPPSSTEQQYHQVQQPYETIDSISHQQQQLEPKDEYSGSAKFGTNGQGNEEVCGTNKITNKETHKEINIFLIEFALGKNQATM